MALQLEHAEGVDRLEHDPRWSLLQRTLGADVFRRSPRLAEFLRYVTEMTLLENDAALSEQRVGEAVFGRAADYDSSADTVVRSSALRLRRQLELYFQRDGAAEPVMLTLPRGSYRVHFEARHEEVEASEHASVPAPLTAPAEIPDVAPLPAVVSSQPRRWPVLLLIALLCVALCAQSWILLRRSSQKAPATSGLLWPQLFTQNHPTRIVLGDSGLVLFHAVTHRYLSLTEYLDHRYDIPPEVHAPATPEFAQFLAGRRYTSVVDATALARLARLPEATPDRTLVTFARDLRLEDLKDGNLVLFGAQEADPWVELFERTMDFQFHGPDGSTSAFFSDAHPASGQPQSYQANGGRVFAVVAFLPNLNNSGNVLLLEGLNMTGTESALDFVLEKDRMEPLLAKMREANGTIPYFEILLECRSVTNDATPATIVQIRTHPAKH